MSQNINYIGMVNLLRHLQTAGLVSRKEAGRIAAQLRAETGADVIFFPPNFCWGWIWIFRGYAGIVCC